MITLCHIFYNQHEMLNLHRIAWNSHKSGSLKYVLIDDGSPTPVPDEFQRDDLKVYRITEDIPWNIAGARNLAFHVAKTEWVLLADIDHVLTSNVVDEILKLSLEDDKVAYTFARRREDGVIGCDAIINVLMNKKKYFEIGGHDEDFSGHYGKEETFFWRCLRRKGIRILKQDHIVLSWHPKVGGTKGLLRDKSFNDVIFKIKADQLERGQYKNGAILRFGWDARSD